MSPASFHPFPMQPFRPRSPPHTVHRVAITGGPCAGKTTALAEISERLRSRGFPVYVVPEAATLLFTGGASFAGMDDDQVLNFQAQLLRTQMSLEDAFTAVARASRKTCFILSDRGACDGRAYMSEKMWRRMLAENGWDMVQLRDARYDLVLHLVTAADGATDFYSLENNKARTETPQEAVDLDRKTQKAWVGHPHLSIVDNRTGFREKINRIDSRVSELAGVHLSKRIVRKFLIREEDPHALGGIPGVEDFAVEQTFLQREGDDKVQESVRRRGKNGKFTYVHKVRKDNYETKRQITCREFRSLLPHRDPDRETVRIRRQCFLYSGNYFVLDHVENVEPPARLLRCHCDAEDVDRLEMPRWLEVVREVTGDKALSMHSLSEGASNSIPIPERFGREDDVNADDFLSMARSF